MSVLVKNMDMPKECRECPISDYFAGFTRCTLLDIYLAKNYETIAFDGRHPDCPLVEVDDEEDDE